MKGRRKKWSVRGFITILNGFWRYKKFIREIRYDGLLSQPIKETRIFNTPWCRFYTRSEMCWVTKPTEKVASTYWILQISTLALIAPRFRKNSIDASFRFRQFRPLWHQDATWCFLKHKVPQALKNIASKQSRPSFNWGWSITGFHWEFIVSAYEKVLLYFTRITKIVFLPRCKSTNLSFD